MICVVTTCCASGARTDTHASMSLSRMAANNGVKNIAATLKCGTADVILTSSETRQGLQQVYDRLERIIELYAEPDEEGEEESDMKNSDGGED